MKTKLILALVAIVLLSGCANWAQRMSAAGAGLQGNNYHNSYQHRQQQQQRDFQQRQIANDVRFMKSQQQLKPFKLGY